MAFVCLLFFGFTPGSFAQQRQTSLAEILQTLESENPELKAFDNRARSEDAKIKGVTAWMPPMIGAGTFMTPYPFQKPGDENNKGAFMISAEQDIPNPAKQKARRLYQASLSQTYFLGRTERFNELRATARERYYNLLVDYKRLKFQKESRQIMQTMKKLAEIRYPYNQGGLNQIFKAEGRLSEAENMILMTEASIKAAKSALNALMNRQPGAELQIDTSFQPVFKPVANLDSNYLAETRSDILHMQHQIHSMEMNISRIRQEALPDFRIRFDHMSNYSAMMPKQFTVMGMLSIPIAPWSSRMYKSDIQAMNFEIAAMQQQKQGMLNEVLGMTKGMEAEILSIQKQVGNYEKKILPALRKNLDVSMLSYQENKMDIPLVIDAWEALNMSQMTYLDQLQKYYKLLTEYEKNVER